MTQNLILPNRFLKFFLFYHAKLKMSTVMENIYFLSRDKYQNVLIEYIKGLINNAVKMYIFNNLYEKSVIKNAIKKPGISSFLKQLNINLK